MQCSRILFGPLASSPLLCPHLLAPQIPPTPPPPPLPGSGWGYYRLDSVDADDIVVRRLSKSLAKLTKDWGRVSHERKVKILTENRAANEALLAAPVSSLGKCLGCCARSLARQQLERLAEWEAEKQQAVRG